MKHVIFAIHKNPAEEKNLIISKLLIEDYIDGNLRIFGQERKELPYAHKDAILCTVDYVAGRNRYNGLDVGFAYDGDTGRILVRESGTEPVIRVMIEAESEEICQKYVDMVV